MRANILYLRLLAHEEEVEVGSLEEAQNIAAARQKTMSNNDFRDCVDESVTVAIPGHIRASKIPEE